MITNRVYSHIVSIDFDGTCVTNEFPKVGIDIGAEIVLRKILKKGNKIILNTCRGGVFLEDAINWFKEKEIKLSSINESINKKSDSSNKVYAKIYIDDCNLGCPLINNGKNKPYVDWIKVEEMLKIKGIV